MVNILSTKDNIRKEEYDYAARFSLNIKAIPFTKKIKLPFEVSINIIQQYDAIIFTSQYAVDFFLQDININIPLKTTIFCIGFETKNTLQITSFFN